MASKDEAPKFMSFPVTKYNLMKFHQFYYAIGNNPAACVFYRNESSAFEGVNLIENKSWRRHSFDPVFEAALENSSSKPTKMRILCLACGDVRNILFSLAGLDGKTSKSDRIDVVVNDYDVHVLARNILLLDSIFDEKLLMDEAIFAIWFSTGLSTAQREYLDGRLCKLILEVDEPSKKADAWAWQCYEPELLLSLREVWQKWRSFFDDSESEDTSSSMQERGHHWNTTQRMRHENLLKRWQSLFWDSRAPSGATDRESSPEARCREFMRNKSVHMSQSFGYWKFNFQPDVFSDKMQQTWEDELVTHTLTGVFNPSAREREDEQWQVNPTLFWSKDKYDLHYGTNSYKAFPTLVPRKGSRLVDLCFEEFQTWLKAAREHQECLSWTFSSSDVQTFCLNFDPSVMGWKVAGSEAGESRSVPEKADGCSDGFRTGALVRAHSLQGNPHLNSCFGILTQEVPGKGRWGVHFFKQGGGAVAPEAQALPEHPVSLKLANLAVVPVQDTLLTNQSSRLACFHVITTSNVADHLGILPLLLLCRPLLVPGGALLTTCFLHVNRHGSTAEFLHRSLLGTAPAWWTTLFGFRAMGYEPESVASQACQVAHNQFNLSSGSKDVTDSSMVWLATAHECNLPLALQGPIGCALTEFHLLETGARGHGVTDGARVALTCRWRAFTGFGPHIPEAVVPRHWAGEPEWVLLSRILCDCAARDGSLDLAVALCSIDVADATLRRAFCPSSNSTPVLYVEAGEQKFAGLWADEAHRGEAETRLFFFCLREVLDQSNWTVTLCSLDELSGRSASRMQVHAKEQRVHETQMQRISAHFLAGAANTEARQSPSATSAHAGEKTRVMFHLFGESESEVQVQVQASSAILGSSSGSKLSSNQFQLSQSATNSFALRVEVQLPCTAPSGRRLHLTIHRELMFAVPVTAEGWRYDAEQCTLVLRKAPYPFFSAVRRVCGGNRFGLLKHGGGTSGWTDRALGLFGAAQFTAGERGWRLRKIRDTSCDLKMPMLTEVKDSFFSLLQQQDVLTYLLMKEPGCGVVGMLIRHGLLLDKQMNAPVMQFSVCWLSQEISLDMAKATQHLAPDGYRHLKMWCEEYALLQNLCNHCRASVDPALRTEHPELRKLIASKRLRGHWRRVLLRPLFPSEAEQEAAQEQAISTVLSQHLQPANTFLLKPS